MRRIRAATLGDAATTQKGAFDMVHLRRGTSLIVIPLLALTLLLAACGTSTANPAAPVGGEFVGEAGTLAAFGLSTDGRQVIAYLCDGTTDHQSLAEWFTGAVTNGTIAITNAHGARLAATLSAQAVTGTVTLKDGRSARVTAQLISNPGNQTGLYRSAQTVNGVAYLGGWIDYPPNSAGVSRGIGAFVAGALVPLPTCCVPNGRDRGAIIDQQTGALLPSPLVNLNAATLSLQVPDVGTFTLHLCRRARC